MDGTLRFVNLWFCKLNYCCNSVIHEIWWHVGHQMKHQ
jgi:hypothetical protein